MDSQVLFRVGEGSIALWWCVRLIEVCGRMTADNLCVVNSRFLLGTFLHLMMMMYDAVKGTCALVIAPPTRNCGVWGVSRKL
jgi:hypothetical protein